MLVVGQVIIIYVTLNVMRCCWLYGEAAAAYGVVTPAKAAATRGAGDIDVIVYI